MLGTARIWCPTNAVVASGHSGYHDAFVEDNACACGDEHGVNSQDSLRAGNDGSVVDDSCDGGVGVSADGVNDIEGDVAYAGIGDDGNVNGGGDDDDEINGGAWFDIL